MVVVGTALARAFFRAHLAISKALTIHFETFGFLACATSFFLLGDGGCCVDVVRTLFELVLYGDFGFFGVFGLLGDVLIEAD